MNDPYIIIGPVLIVIAFFLLISKGQADAKRRDREERDRELIDAVRENDPASTDAPRDPEAKPHRHTT